MQCALVSCILSPCGVSCDQPVHETLALAGLRVVNFCVREVQSLLSIVACSHDCCGD